MDPHVPLTAPAWPLRVETDAPFPGEPIGPLPRPVDPSEQPSPFRA